MFESNVEQRSALRSLKTGGIRVKAVALDQASAVPMQRAERTKDGDAVCASPLFLPATKFHQRTVHCPDIVQH
jgi:hypothetical protein